MPSSRQSIYYLVIINCVIFALSYFLKVEEMQSFALYFPLNDSFHIWQFISHMFMHGSIAHILFNMYALWSFGTPLEKSWQTPKFVGFYFVTGICAALVHSVVSYYQFNSIVASISDLGYSAAQIEYIIKSGSASREVINVVGEDVLFTLFSIYHSPVIGASGAMYGILVAYAFSYPHAKLSLIFLPAPIRAKYFVPLLIAGDMFFGLTNYSVGNIAHFAHIGGALTGLLIMLAYKKRKSIT